MDNPLYFEGPQHKFNTEDASEYHPSNISRYPKFKKYMNDFIKISANRHIDFESVVGAKDSHLLDFTDIGIQKKKYSNTGKEKDISVKEKNNNFIKLNGKSFKICLKVYWAPLWDSGFVLVSLGRLFGLSWPQGVPKSEKNFQKPLRGTTLDSQVGAQSRPQKLS